MNDFDYSKLLELLDKEKLNNINKNLANQALANDKIEYEDLYVKLTVPSTVVELLKTLTDIFPVELEDVLSKMATQGLNNILQGAMTPEENNTNETNPLDNIDSINQISDQLSDLQNVITRFADMQKIFEGFTNEAITNKTRQNSEDT